MPGGGVALLYGSRELEDIKGKSMSFDQKIGVDIVQKALLMPLKTIASNAGALPVLHLLYHAVQGPCTFMLSRIFARPNLYTLVLGGAILLPRHLQSRPAVESLVIPSILHS